MASLLIKFIIIFAVFLFTKIKLLKHLPSDTASGAIVMGLGIFIVGPIRNIPRLNNLGEIFAVMLFTLWVFILSSFINSLLKGSFRESHLSNPVKSFAVGTWVAGTSVCGVVIYQRLPLLAPLIRVLFFVNFALWLFYLFIVVVNYREIIKNSLQNKLHGVLLLSTVSTQSLVVLGSNIFPGRLPFTLSRALILLGTALYFLTLAMIIWRYFFTITWNIEDDWLVTNCIIHGAMSITGLASVLSGAVKPDLILLIWLWVIIWLIIIEAIEIYRALKRIKKYGFKKGIAIYDVTQWSRIFTFGMFYTFTMKFNLKFAPHSKDKFLELQGYILKNGAWMVALFIFIELVLFFREKTVNIMEVKE